MADEKLKAEVDVDDVNGRLAAGLETCRAMIANYKSLLKERDVEVLRGDGERPAGTCSVGPPLANDTCRESLLQGCCRHKL